MSDLVEFLRARYDEDAQAALRAKPGPWHSDGGSVYATHPTDEVVDYTEDSADHIARHDPARVLAEVDAKRAIVDEFERCGLKTQGHSGLRFAAIMLATPHRGHQDFNQLWLEG